MSSRLLRPRWIALVTVLLAAAWLGAGWISAWIVCRPYRGGVPALESLAGLPVVDLELQTSDGERIAAWFVERDPECCAILVAGIGANRDACRRRAESYLEVGWSVLLADLRATGESSGDTVSLGWHERRDVLACYEFLRGRGCERIAAHGISLGAAAILFGLDLGAEYEFLVLEACYTDAQLGLENRLPWVPWPRLVLWPLALFVEQRIGVAAELMRPIDHIGRVEVPVLFLSGDRDGAVGMGEVQALFDACPSEEKLLHLFEGADHVNLLAHAPAEFRRVLGEFLARHGE